eukprot:2653928-Prymnesium_polylepis.2
MLGKGSVAARSPAGAAGETGHAAAAAEPRVRLRTARWSRARPALMLSVLAFGGHRCAVVHTDAALRGAQQVA